MSGYCFLDLVVFNQESLRKHSLNDMCVDLKQRHKKQISRQSLNERFNEKAIEFLKQIMGELIQDHVKKQSISTELLKGFKKVLIKDSTCFQVDESLADTFPGSGGSGSKAAIRIQFEYDILSGKINDLSISAFNEQDQTNSLQTTSSIEEGVLVIRDLGYISNDFFMAVNQKHAFFLGRLQVGVNVIQVENGKRKRVDFKKLYRQMKSGKLKQKEIVIELCKKKSLLLRLFIYLLPEKVVQERLRRAKRNAVKKGRNLGKVYVLRAHFNLLVSNAFETNLKLDQAWDLYRLRWQVELIFKTWKSICEISEVKKVSLYRLLAYIYSRLILILINWSICWGVHAIIQNKHPQCQISFYKAFKTLWRWTQVLRNAIMEGTLLITELLRNFLEISVSKHVKDRKKNEQNIYLLEKQQLMSVT